jgi:DNA-binding transcriptional ArsR family regulator
MSTPARDDGTNDEETDVNETDDDRTGDHEANANDQKADDHSERDDDPAFAEQTAVTRLLGDHPKVKILSALSSESQDVTVSRIAELAGTSRSTVYDHLDDLRDVNVVVKTREVGGSPLYELNEDDEAARKFAQLEWAFLDNVAEE